LTKQKKILKSVVPADDSAQKDEVSKIKDSQNLNIDEIMWIAKQKKKNKKLYNFLGEEKERMTKQFEELRLSTLTEMERSKSLLETMKTLKDIEEKTGDTDKTHELDTTISALEGGIKKYQIQLLKIEEKMRQIGEMEERAEKTLEKLSTRFTKNKEDKSSIKKLTLSQIKEQLDKFKSKLKKNNVDRNNKETLKEDPAAKSNTEDTNKEEVDLMQKKPEFGYFEGSFEDYLDGEGGEGKNKIIEGDSNEAAIETEANKQKKEDLQVRVRTLDAKDIEKEFGDEESDERARMLEEKVKKQLESLGLNLQDKIKIKVITTKDKFNQVSKGDELLSTDQLDDVKDMFLGILNGNQEKKIEEKRQISLEESYNQVWTDENETEEE